MKYKVIIWGFSEKAIFDTMKYTRKSNVEVLCIVDNDKTKQNIPGPVGELIKSPQEVVKYDFDYIIVASLSSAAITEQLLEMNVNRDKILYLPNRAESYKDVLRDYSKIDSILENYNRVYKWIYQTPKDSVDNLELLVKKSKIIHKYISKDGYFDFKGVKIPYEAYLVQPDSFIAEAFDILGEILDKEGYYVFNEGPYEYGQIFVENGDIVIDAGANLGVFSAYAAFKTENGGVYSFEPIKKVSKILEKTAELNHNIKIENYAVSNINGTVRMSDECVENGTNIGAAKIIESFTGDKSTVEVSCITIDDFVKDNNLTKVDFIKADIEGAEPDMIYGASETIKKFQPKLSICTYHQGNHPELIESIIMSINPNYVIEHRWEKLLHMYHEDRKKLYRR